MEPVDGAFPFEDASEAPEAPPPVPSIIPFPGAVAETPPPDEDLDAAGPLILARLLAVEERVDRFQRLLRTWITKINDAIGRGDVDEAVRWMEVVTRDLDVGGDRAPSVRSAVAELAGPAVLESLVVSLVEKKDGDLAETVLGYLGPAAIDQLLVWMAVDDPPVPRLYLVDLLTMAGRNDVRALAVHIGDERWFVVRNVVIALGRSGRPQAVEAVRSALGHADDRVRVEVLRALSVLQGERAVPTLFEALTDRSGRVRHAVLSLLRASPSRLVVTGAVGAVEAGSVGADEAAQLVRLIAERRDDAVVPSLRQIAGMRATGRSRRAARAAAQKALAERTP
jgi:HEAT repeat protein